LHYERDKGSTPVKFNSWSLVKDDWHSTITNFLYQLSYGPNQAPVLLACWQASESLASPYVSKELVSKMKLMDAIRG